MPFFRKKKKEVRMTMRGCPCDVNTSKCLIMAAEKKVKLEVQVLDVKGGAADENAFRALSPFGKHPYLEEGDFSTSSVNAVLAFLDVRGEGGLSNPAKAQLFGQQNYWSQIARTKCEPALKVLVDVNVYGEAGDTDAACATINTALDALNDFIDNKEYIVGEYSFADVHWTAVAHLLTVAGAEEAITSRSNLSAWFNRVKARPSYGALPSLDEMKNKQLRSVA